MDTPAPRALAVCGWTPDASEALSALEATGAFRAVGVTDPSGAALVRARAETALPCSRQGRQWLATASYEAVLVGSAQSASLITLAASRRADLLLLPGAYDPHTLEAAAEAARTSGVRLVLLRPDAHDAGLADLARLVEPASWHPHYLEVTVEGATDVDRLLGTAVAHAVRLLPKHDGVVQASGWPASATPARAVSAILRTAQGEVHLRARHAPSSFLRIAGEAPGGSVELRLTEHEATFQYATSTGDRARYAPGWVDHWRVEAFRAIEADDTQRALEEAAILSAIDRGMATGEPQATDCCQRPALRLIEGRGQAQPGRGRLHLVVS